MQIKLTEGSRDPSCPLCSEPATGADIDSCPLCATGYHRDCVAEMGTSCAVLGCQGRFVDQEQAKIGSRGGREVAKQTGDWAAGLALTGLCISLVLLLVAPDFLSFGFLTIALGSGLYSLRCRGWAEVLEEKRFKPGLEVPEEGAPASLEGEAQATESLTTPEGREAIWFETWIERCHIRGRKRRRVFERINHTVVAYAVPFRIGEVEVDHALTVVEDAERLVTSLIKQGEGDTEGDERRVTEYIPVGQRVSVQGWLTMAGKGPRLVNGGGSFLFLSTKNLKDKARELKGWSVAAAIVSLLMIFLAHGLFPWWILG